MNYIYDHSGLHDPARKRELFSLLIQPTNNKDINSRSCCKAKLNVFTRYQNY